GAGFLFQIALLDGAERRGDQEKIDLVFLDATGQLLNMAAAHIGRGLDLADPNGFRKDDVESDGTRQALEFGLPRLDAAMHPNAAHFGTYQPGACWMLALVDKRPGAAQAVLVLFKMIHIVPSVVVVVLLRVEQLDWRTRHDCRDRVLIDQLRLSVTTQKQTEIVEPGDDTLKLDTVHEEDRDRDFLLANVVEKGVLQVLLLFTSHFWPLLPRPCLALLSSQLLAPGSLRNCRPAPPDPELPTMANMTHMLSAAYPRKMSRPNQFGL